LVYKTPIFGAPVFPPNLVPSKKKWGKVRGKTKRGQKGGQIFFEKGKIWIGKDFCYYLEKKKWR